MLLEALKYLADLGQKASAPHRVDVKDPRRAHFVVGGQVLDLDLPAPPRDHHAGSLSEVVALANRFAGSPSARPVVWYDAAAVVLVIDDATGEGLDGHRVEKATLRLEPSDVFSRLVALRERPREAWFDQKAFIRLLRIELAGALPPVALLNTVRKVRFENGVTTTSEKRSQRESLGREITSQVSADAELPEEVTLNVPVYKTPGESERYPLRCTVEVEPGDGTFRLLPLPDEVERVRFMAIDSVGDRLAHGLTETVPHYFGKP